MRAYLTPSINMVYVSVDSAEQSCVFIKDQALQERHGGW